MLRYFCLDCQRFAMPPFVISHPVSLLMKESERTNSLQFSCGRAQGRNDSGQIVLDKEKAAIHRDGKTL